MVQPVVVCPVGAAFCGVFIVQPVVMKRVIHPVALKPVVVQPSVVPPAVLSFVFFLHPVMVRSCCYTTCFVLPE